MARGSAIECSSAETGAVNLSRALSRLEHKILSTSADPRLKKSSYERAKTSANVEYARDLLLRLEHSASNIKVQTRKQATQSTLHQQRALIKRLNDRLYELNQQDDGNISSDSSEEDLLCESVPPVPNAPVLATTSDSSSPNLDRRKQASSLQPEITTTFRPRLLPSKPTSKTTGYSSVGQLEPPTPSAAILLESDSSTQAQLTNSLLSLATALKQSSLALSASLSADTVTLDNTAAALDKNTDGMASASKRIGMLRSMSEGRWWWGRMLLYVFIAGLWALALGIVFVGPKLRF